VAVVVTAVALRVIVSSAVVASALSNVVTELIAWVTLSVRRSVAAVVCVSAVGVVIVFVICSVGSETVSKVSSKVVVVSVLTVRFPACVPSRVFVPTVWVSNPAEIFPDSKFTFVVSSRRVVPVSTPADRVSGWMGVSVVVTALLVSVANAGVASVS